MRTSSNCLQKNIGSENSCAVVISKYLCFLKNWRYQCRYDDVKNINQKV